MVGLLQILIILGIAAVVLLAVGLFQAPLAADPDKRRHAYKLGALAVILAIALGAWCFNLMEAQVGVIGDVSAPSPY